MCKVTTIMRSFLFATLILSTIFSCCDGQNQFVPIPINTFTSRRIMNIAANHIGVTLVREISAFQMANRPIYRVNFEARSRFGTVLTCNAVVRERSIGNGIVTRWNCLF